jgi:hypothetical protein
VGCCEHCDELSGCVKCGEYLHGANTVFLQWTVLVCGVTSELKYLEVQILWHL